MLRFVVSIIRAGLVAADRQPGGRAAASVASVAFLGAVALLPALAQAGTLPVPGGPKPAPIPSKAGRPMATDVLIYGRGVIAAVEGTRTPLFWGRHFCSSEYTTADVTHCREDTGECTYLTYTRVYSAATPVVNTAPVPFSVFGRRIVKFSGGHQLCALDDAGGVRCAIAVGDWDRETNRPENDEIRYGAVYRVPLDRWEAIDMASGAGEACVLTSDGEVVCWSSPAIAFTHEEVASGPSYVFPEARRGIDLGAVQISLGPTIPYGCAVTTGGDVRCWGEPPLQPRAEDRTLPRTIAGLETGITKVSAGREHACALRDDGGVRCFGRNTFGQLGDGTDTGRSSAVDVVGLPLPAIDVVAGISSTCAILADRTARCWGRNLSGLLGDGSRLSSPRPVAVSGLEGASRIALGERTACAVYRTADVRGGVRCWGSDEHGQLGNGAGGDSRIPEGVLRVGQHRTCEFDPVLRRFVCRWE